MGIYQDHFYHSTIRNVTAAFGSLFTNIKIERVDENNVVVNNIRVPLAYASGDKTLRMLNQQDQIRREGQTDIKISLPRLSFHITNISYDSARKTQTTKYLIHNNTLNSQIKYKQYNAVPYNIEFSLYLFVKYIDDGLQVIEQILPFFRPHYTITTKDVPGIDLLRDVPITLTSVSQEDIFEGEVAEDRLIQWTLTFTANTWVYPPVSNSKVIKKAYTNIFDLDTEEKLYGTLAMIDPLDANENDPHETIITRT